MALTIHDVPFDDPTRPYIIAEASGNHHQDQAQACRLVEAAAAAGADAIKFQTYTAEEICADVPLLFGHNAAHDAWARRLGVTRLRALFALGGLPRAWHAPLKALAASLGLAFLSTPFSVDAARFLVEEIGVPALKIASGDLTFLPLLDYAARTGLPVLLSTGGATLCEVRHALHRLRPPGQPTPVGVFHCVSVYPCPDDAVNLRAVHRMHASLADAQTAVGWSDHTLSPDVIPALAVMMGATVIEKHLRLTEDTTSVDAAHSLTPAQFRHMIAAVRALPAILGHGEKIPHALELHDRLFARRDPSDWLRPQMRGRLGAWE